MKNINKELGVSVQESGLRILILSTVFCLLSTCSLMANIEDIISSSRLSGLSYAGVAQGDDVYSVEINPAGYARVETPILGTSLSKFYVGLDDGTSPTAMFLGYAQNIRHIFSMGTSYKRLSLDSLFKEEALGISVAREIRMIRGFDLGLTAKNMTRSYGTTLEISNAINQSGFASGAKDPVFKDRSARSALSLDVGALYRMGSSFTLGASVMNLNRPNLALAANDRAPLARVTRFGLAYRFSGTGLYADGAMREALENYTDYHGSFGFEHWLNALGPWTELGFRGGIQMGTRSLRNISFGASYRHLRLFAVDYAFHLPLAGIASTSGTHELSLKLAFGRPFPGEELKAEVAREREYRREIEKILEYEKAKARQQEREIERLRAELELLMGKAQLSISQPAVQPSAASESAITPSPTVPEPVVQQQPTVTPVIVVPKAEVSQKQQAFKRSWQFYMKLKKEGATMQEKLVILESIRTRYEGQTGIDIGGILQEIQSLKSHSVGIEGEFQEEMKEYRKMVDRKAGKAGQARFLKKILERYSGAGIDLSPVRLELRRLLIEE